MILHFLKLFNGTIVDDYPCKGFNLNEATRISLSGGEKPVNPLPIGRIEKIKNGEN
jgi:hypothetical protein